MLTVAITTAFSNTKNTVKKHLAQFDHFVGIMLIPWRYEDHKIATSNGWSQLCECKRPEWEGNWKPAK
jgi:hypothetical protein